MQFFNCKDKTLHHEREICHERPKMSISRRLLETFATLCSSQLWTFSQKFTFLHLTINLFRKSLGFHNVLAVFFVETLLGVEGERAAFEDPRKHFLLLFDHCETQTFVQVQLFSHLIQKSKVRFLAFHLCSFIILLKFHSVHLLIYFKMFPVVF